MEAKQISKAVIKRLPRYYRYLGELLEDNVERISSNDLSKKMRVTTSQIRQDLNNFGGFGHKILRTKENKLQDRQTSCPNGLSRRYRHRLEGRSHKSKLQWRH